MEDTKEESLVNDILHEYHGLEECLRSLGKLATNGQAGNGDRHATDSVYEHLRRVRRHMERLFECEERSGLYDDLLSLLPTESPRIAALKEEHPGLLARINALIARMDEPEVADLLVLGSEIRSFVRALESHEQRERSLLQQPYYSEDGTVD